MNPSVSDQNLYLFAAGLFSATIGFIIYYFVISLFKSRLYFINKQDPANNFRYIIFKRLLGFILFGLLPQLILFLIDRGKYSLPGTKVSFGPEALKWVLILAVIIIPMNFIAGTDKKNLLIYPEIRNKEWSFSLLFLSSLSWITYLLGYEFLFRGLLLFPAVELMGFWPAVLINLALYSLVHVPKGRREALGAIPLGLVLCYISVTTGSFWTAFFIHVILALSNEWFSLRFHPEIKLIKVK